MYKHSTEIDVFNIIRSGINLEKRELYILGEIEDSIVQRFLPALKYLELSEGPIKVILSSPGGGESEGYAIYDALMGCKNQIIIEAYGHASSIATAILQAGDIRFVSRNCEILIHNGTSPTDEDMEQDAVIDLAEKIKKDNEKYYTILNSKSRLSLEQVKQFCKDEKTFTSKEAVELGLADDMLPFNKKFKKPSKRKR